LFGSWSGLKGNVQEELAAVLAVLGVGAVYALDKCALQSPSGIAFSDFRGYQKR
jgi:hypothetical protein